MSTTQPVYLGQLHKCHQCQVMCHFSASDAYQYMQCARKLYYDKTRGYRVISPELQELFTKGKQEHDRVKKELSIKYKNIHFEQSFTKQVNQYILHGHCDAIVYDWIGSYNWNLIEIKPKYGLGAYNQTLMYKLLAPEYHIHIAEYKDNSLQIFPLKADINMAKVYFARLVTASKILAPRLPKYPDTFNCRNCDVKDQCTKDSDYKWNMTDTRLHDKLLDPLTFRSLADQTYKEIFG